MGGDFYQKENQRGFWQLTWPLLYRFRNSRFIGYLPPAGFPPTKSAIHLQGVTVGLKGLAPGAEQVATCFWSCGWQFVCSFLPDVLSC